MTAATGEPGDRPPDGSEAGGPEAPLVETAPAYGGSDVPIGSPTPAPVYPAYETPVYPAYGTPVDPAYGTPVDPAYGTPVYPAYETPPQPAWADPGPAASGFPPAGPAPVFPPFGEQIHGYPGPYPPPGYPPPPYGPGYPPGPMAYPPAGYPGYPGYPPPVRSGTNSSAIAALVCSILGLAPLCGFLFSIAGIVAGAVGINQIRRTGQSGYGLAIAGIVVGILTLVIWMVGLSYAWG